MSAQPDNWMPLYIGSYMKKTTRLTREQHGTYLLLIMDSWINGAPPDDDAVLASIVKASPAEWRRLRPVVSQFFQIEEGKWCHDKIEKERGRAVDIIDKKRAAGSAGGKAARGKSGRKKNSERIADAISEQIADGIADPIANECQNNTPLPSQSHSPNGEISSLREERVVVEIPDWIPREAWAGFVEMRKKIKASITEQGKLLLIAKLRKMRNSEDIGAVLDQSTMNSWKGVFPVKHDGNSNGKRSTPHQNFALGAYLATEPDAA